MIESPGDERPILAPPEASSEGLGEMLELIGVRKRYGSFEAVKGIDLKVHRGEIFGFLGPNGAGKTTTIRMIAGVLRPTAGRVIVGGDDLAQDPESAKARVGYIPDRPYLYEKLSAAEFLRFVAGLWGREGPEVIVVDEPMVGLDPRSAKLLKDLFRTFAGHGGTVFLSTHTLEVAESLCDRIAIINEGEIIALGTMDDLRSQAQAGGAHLEEIFLKVTGGEAMHYVIESLREAIEK